MLTETAKNKVLRQEMELLRNINRTLQDQASLQIEKENIHCLRELCVVDPEIEMREIEDRKDSLLQMDPNLRRVQELYQLDGQQSTPTTLDKRRCRPITNRYYSGAITAIEVSYFFIQRPATAVWFGWFLSRNHHLKKEYDTIGPVSSILTGRQEGGLRIRRFIATGQADQPFTPVMSVPVGILTDITIGQTDQTDPDGPFGLGHVSGIVKLLIVQIKSLGELERLPALVSSLWCQTSWSRCYCW